MHYRQIYISIYHTNKILELYVSSLINKSQRKKNIYITKELLDPRVTKNKNILKLKDLHADPDQAKRYSLSRTIQCK